LQEVYDSFRLIVAESHDVVAQKCLLASASVPAYERVLGSDVPKLLISVIGERLKNSSDDLQEPETQQFQRALALLLQRIDPSLSTEAATESEKHLYSHLVIPLDNDLAQGRAKWRAEALARKGRAEPAAEGERVSTPAGVVSYSFDFTSNAGKSDAIERYGNHWTTDSWTCSEASLARTARVDPADLSKWKKGSLPSGSDKAKRIEDVLRDNKRPTPTAPRTADT
jgi:hypothetical protein